jgi:cobalt-zinc-cadmium resistance protein CzcA
MIDRLVRFSLEARSFVMGLAVLIAAAGTYFALQLPVDAVPDITGVQVVVNSETGAMDPSQVENSVTYVVETELAGLPGVVEVRSLSRFGLSQVVATFEEGTDVYRARTMVVERLQNVRGRLPAGISPEPGPISTGLGEVFLYVLRAKDGSDLARRPEAERLLYLRTVQDFVVQPYLKSRIPRIAEVDTIGGYKKEIHVEFLPQRLERLGVTLEEVLLALDSLGQNFGGGYIERNDRQIIVRTNGVIDDLDAIRAMPVRLNVYGGPVRLDRIARVRAGALQRTGAATYNGEETVLGTVLMLLGANSREVALAAREAADEVQLPADVELVAVYSRDYLVNSTIRTVLVNLGEGAALVVVVLLLILGNVRAALIVSLAIPLSMLVAVSGMLQLHISANLMSLGAIDFGLLVDASVVIVENVLRRLEAKPELAAAALREKLEVVYEAAREVARPVAFGLFIIMVVYVPILGLEGIEGKMFHPMAWTVLMALGASLLIALGLMPALALTFLVRGRKLDASGEALELQEPLLFRFFSRIYRPLLRRSLAHPFLGLVPAVILGLFGILAFTQLGASFIPQLGEGDLLVSFVRDPGMSLRRSIELQKESEDMLLEFPEIERVFARIGTAEAATDPMGVYMGDTFAILKKDRGQWRTDVDLAELREQLRTKFTQRYPDQEITISQPIEFRFNELLEGSRADVNVRIFGRDLETLFHLQERARDILAEMPDVESAELDAITALRRGPVLDVRVNRERLPLFGVPLRNVNETLEAAMGGRTVGWFYEQDRRFPIVVRLAGELRDQPGEIRRIPVGLGDGGTVSLGELAAISEREAIVNIARHGARRYAAVAIELGGGDTLGFVRAAQEKIERELRLPEGYYAEWGGQFRNLERARARLSVVIPIVMVVIFVLLLRSFGSLRQTMLVFLSVPFALTGGVIALYLRDIPFSVPASVGFIALSGIAILNAMVMVTFFNQLREEGETAYDAVFRGAYIRLRPVLMTALVASLGFLPMAVNTGLGAEVQRPLATVVIGGLLTATALTLLLLPALYLRLHRR